MERRRLQQPGTARTVPGGRAWPGRLELQHGDLLLPCPSERQARRGGEGPAPDEPPGGDTGAERSAPRSGAGGRERRGAAAGARGWGPLPEP